jgi:Dinucleotide-utilizing enzymes involved in molybdopterin and thiamine biosynthesis family 2
MIIKMEERFLGLLKKKNYIDVISEISKDSYKIKFRLRNGYEVPLIIIFNEFFPAELPFVYIDISQLNIPQKPHILKGGYICYLSEEGIVWSDNPEIALDLVFEKVEDVLLESNEIIQYQKEFNYYFSTLENRERAISLYSPTNDIEEIYIFDKKKDHPLAFLRNDNDFINIVKNILGINEGIQLHSKALFIPLDKPYEGNVPQNDQFWSADDICNIVVNSISPEKLKKIESFSINKANYYYLLEIPLLTGSKVVIGLWYRKVASYCKKSIPIIETNMGQIFDIKPILIIRCDDNSIIYRGGGIIKESNILLIGCGSVGSDILFLLARSGLKNFTIVDPDELKVENSYRHFLGIDKAIEYKYKTELLKEEMERRYPNTKIEKHNKDILYLINSQEVNVNDYDLIICAIGNPNTERLLNRMILKTNTPAIFTWVEAYGLGGHALLVNNGGVGCYDCLFDKDLNNCAAFAGKSDKPYTKNINGCTGTFTPYGSIDSMETALNASRLALRVINKQIKGNPLFSWKGDSLEFTNNGFHTSPRYLIDLDHLERGNFDYINPTCKYCSKEGNHGMIFEVENRKIKINDEVLINIFKRRQLHENDCESGGMLIGSIIKDTNDIIIEDLTTPIKDDTRTRIRYNRSQKHNKLLEEKWEKSQYTKMYFGEWHTHPQNDPFHSSQDIKNWMNLMRKSKTDTDILLFLIAGNSSFKVWAGNCKRKMIYKAYEGDYNGLG